MKFGLNPCWSYLPWRLSLGMALLSSSPALEMSGKDKKCELWLLKKLKYCLKVTEFYPRLGKYFLGGLTIAIGTAVHSSLTAMWESSQWLSKNIMWILVKNFPEMH